MDSYASIVGWWLFVALMSAMAGHLAYVVLRLTWDKATVGQDVVLWDILIAAAKTVGNWLQLLKSSWLATVCTVATFVVLWLFTDAIYYVSLGYAALTYAISGVITPAVVLRLKPLASNSSQASSPEQSSD